MDHTKLVLIVAISVFAIILTSCASFLQSDAQSDVTNVNTVSNESVNPSPSNISTPALAESQKIEYLLDVNGCGGPDNTVWCASKSKCVLPGECVLPIVEEQPVSNVATSPSIQNQNDNNTFVAPVIQEQNSTTNMSQ